jgi:hypothetical protein
MANNFSKTDNHNLAAKIALRRRLLSSAGEYRVLDCFSGSEAIWQPLRVEYQIRDYLALDIKQKRGRLKLDSARFVRECPGDFNVVDLDAYGSPFDQFESVIAWRRRLIVFLTIGAVGMKAQSKTALRIAGLPATTPIGMHAQLHDHITESCLTLPLQKNFRIRQSFEALNPGGSARYIGLEIAPADS